MSMLARQTKPVLLVVLSALAFALSAVGASLATKAGLLPQGSAQRIGLIAMGLVLMVTGNVLPKMRFFERRGFPAARAIAAQRLAGWTLVMAGLAIVGFWIFSATRETLLASSLVGLGAFALVGAAWTWLVLGPREPVDATDGETATVGTAARHALVWILFGLGWCFALFLTDYVWGDEASFWMSVAFSIVLAAGASVQTAHRHRQWKRAQRAKTGPDRD